MITHDTLQSNLGPSEIWLTINALSIWTITMDLFSVNQLLYISVQIAAILGTLVFKLSLASGWNELIRPAEYARHFPHDCWPMDVNNVYYYKVILSTPLKSYGQFSFNFNIK